MAILIGIALLWIGITTNSSFDSPPLAPAPKASAPLRTLFLGDSHATRGFGDGFRDELANLRITNRDHLYYYAVAGVSAIQWWDGSVHNLNLGYFRQDPKTTPEFKVKKRFPSDQSYKISDMIQRTNPDLLIFALGTNDMANFMNHHGPVTPSGIKPNELDVLFSYLVQLHDQRPQLRCFWIGPGLMLNHTFPDDYQNLFFDKLKADVEASHCLYMDSRRIKDTAGESLRPDRPDGIHFSLKKGTFWGKQIALDLKKDLN